MSWINLDYDIKYLEKDIVNQVYGNIDYLRTALINAGYSVNSITNPDAAYATAIADVGSKLQTVENDLDVINDVVESIYWNGHYQISDYFVQANYWRWLDILRDAYDMIINGKGRWAILRLSDCIPTIDNKRIVIRGGTIGT